MPSCVCQGKVVMFTEPEGVPAGQWTSRGLRCEGCGETVLDGSLNGLMAKWKRRQHEKSHEWATEQIRLLRREVDELKAGLAAARVSADG